MMDGQGFRGNMTAPVREGEELDVKIEAVGEKGDGIARKNGFVLFVPGVREGDEVRIRVTKVLRKVGFAERIGEAQGPVEGGSEPAQERAPAREAAPEVVEEEYDTSNDTEDFGEEEEAPADEEAAPEEEPAVEEDPQEEAAPEEDPEKQD